MLNLAKIVRKTSLSNIGLMMYACLAKNLTKGKQILLDFFGFSAILKI